MITVDKIVEVQKEMEYQYNHFESIAFPIIAAKFRSMAELCAEMQEVLVERDELKARVQAYEDEARTRMDEAAAAHDSEVCD